MGLVLAEAICLRIYLIHAALTGGRDHDRPAFTRLPADVTATELARCLCKELWMRKIIYPMSMSVDGYIADRNERFGWAAP
ncbi:MAG TPA: hypothetical protein VL133_08540, partial [Devosia sp.]|nr:hypothetical protein [Devosia sp.]